MEALRHIVEGKHSHHLLLMQKSCGLMQIIDHIAEHFMWGSKQYITLYGSSEDSDGVSFQIKSDEHVLEWFEMNLEKGVVYIDAQINDFDGPL
jgi:hypothetical protein